MLSFIRHFKPKYSSVQYISSLFLLCLQNSSVLRSTTAPKDFQSIKFYFHQTYNADLKKINENTSIEVPCGVRFGYAATLNFALDDILDNLICKYILKVKV